jgi:ribosomal protein S17
MPRRVMQGVVVSNKMQKTTLPENYQAKQKICSAC